MVLGVSGHTSLLLRSLPEEIRIAHELIPYDSFSCLYALVPLSLSIQQRRERIKRASADPATAQTYPRP